MMKPVTNYLKNVTKSVAYAAADVAKEDLMPETAEFLTDNKDFIKATYAALKNPAVAVRKSVAAIQKSKIYQALDYGARNAFQDLKTGNFYNKERIENDSMKAMGMDISDWNDLSEFGIDDDWESNLGKNKDKKEKDITEGDIKIVNSIEESNAAAANATINAVIASSEMQIKNNRTNMGMIYMQNERLFGGLHKDISAVSMALDNMHKVTSAALTNIDKNTSDFFTAELKLSTERNAMLKELVEIERNKYKSAMDKEKEENDKKKKPSNRWENVNSGGMPSLESYFGVIKSNVQNNINIPGMSGDNNMLQAMLASPFEDVMKSMVRSFIPAMVREASNNLDKTVSGIFSNALARLGNATESGEGILSFVGKVFGINTSVNKGINTGKYEKGPIPFDGLTRKAIMDVIPTYLRRIEAYLTGRPE